MAKCLRNGCDETDLPDFEVYCSNFCRAVDTDTAHRLPETPIPPPPALPRGLLGGRTDRPTGEVAPLRDYGEPVLPTDSEERKNIPIFSGVLNYFPLAVAAVARWSKAGNDKHNPGEPLGWARGKSMDHVDCIARHLLDIETVNPQTGEYEDATALAWRALARLQELEERRLGALPSRGSR